MTKKQAIQRLFELKNGIKDAKFKGREALVRNIENKIDFLETYSANDLCRFFVSEAELMCSQAQRKEGE